MPFLALTFMSSTVAADFYGIHYTTAVMQAIPKPMYWPCFVIATAGALIGSQSLITSTFSIVRQAMRLNCFPPVKILHTGNTSNYRCASSQHSSHLNVLIPCSVWSVCQLLSPPSPLLPPPTPLKSCTQATDSMWSFISTLLYHVVFSQCPNLPPPLPLAVNILHTGNRLNPRCAPSSQHCYTL